MKSLMAGLVAIVFLLVVGFSDYVKALADPLGRVRSYEISCTTTPRRMSPDSGWIPTSAFKFTNGATQIFVGGSDVNTTTAGTPYAASGSESIDGSPSVVWCVTASGSSTVDIFAGTKG